MAATDKADLAPPRPLFTGLRWHRTDHFSFFIPSDWLAAPWQDDRKGIIYRPEPTDVHTLFAVNVNNLNLQIEKSDLPTVAEGLDEALAALPNVHLQHRESRFENKSIILEAIVTYDDQGQRNKRWIRVFYHDTRQVTCIAQSNSPERFAYWMPMFNQAMMTVQVHSQKPSLAAL
jgi:hypothetical protein